MSRQSNFTRSHRGSSRELNLPSLINSNDLLLNASQSLPLCWRGDEDKIAEPAERGCAWGGPVITVNWFNMGMDGGKHERGLEKEMGVRPPTPLLSLFDLIGCVISALYL